MRKQHLVLLCQGVEGAKGGGVFALHLQAPLPLHPASTILPGSCGGSTALTTLYIWFVFSQFSGPNQNFYSSIPNLVRCSAKDTEDTIPSTVHANDASVLLSRTLPRRLQETMPSSFHSSCPPTMCGRLGHSPGCAEGDKHVYRKRTASA